MQRLVLLVTSRPDVVDAVGSLAAARAAEVATFTPDALALVDALVRARAALAAGTPLRLVCVAAPRQLAFEAWTAALAREAPPTASVVHVRIDDSLDPLVTALDAGADEIHGRVVGARALRAEVDAADLLALPTGASPRVRHALAAAAVDEPFARYPAAPDELRKVLAATHGVPLERIVIGAGVVELLGRVLGATLQPGDRVVANTPSWPLWSHLCRTWPLEWRGVPYRIARGRADHDVDALVAACDRATRLVYVTSPANPGGAALDRAELVRLLERVPRHVTVVVDEAYTGFSERADAADATTFVRHTDARLVVLRSFSKLHGLAGLRIGYAVAAPAIARTLAAAAPPFPLARGLERAALAALADTAHVERARRLAIEARHRLEQTLDAAGVAWLASDAPFVLAAQPDVPGPRFFDGGYVMLALPWQTEVTTR